VNREKRITKREQKAIKGSRPGTAQSSSQHIHCVACGRHIDAAELQGSPVRALMLRCAHGTTFPSCVECADTSRVLLAEHDRTGQNVHTASAWH